MAGGALEGGGAAAQVFRLYGDAIEDSRIAAFALLVIAPASSFAASWLLKRGQNTTPVQVWLLSILVPTLLMAFPIVSEEKNKSICDTN